MKNTILIIFILSFFNLVAQQENKVTNEPVGKFDRQFLQIGKFGEYFGLEYKNYAVDLDLLNPLEKDIFKYDVKIIMAIWCHDSQEQVPRFIKILDKLNYNTKNLEIICVDRNKAAGNIDISKLNIERVPTFIFYKNDVEKGRIIETPASTLEKDMLSIINEQ